MNSPDAATEEVRAPEPPIRLLLVEDSEIDCEMLLATLRRQGMDIRCTRVEDGPAMRSALAHDPPDAIISDHRLPAFSSTAAYDVLRETGLDLPFIIVSGAIGEEAAVEAMRRGVDDYLIKGRLARLSSALRNAIASSRLRRAQRRTQEELARSKQALEQLSAHLLEKIEDERTALAREIHDDVGGTLASLRFDLAWIERHGSTEVSERARRTVESVAEAMAAVQRLIRDLRPPVLDAGIVAALEWQLDQFRRRTGLATRFSSNVESIELPDELGDRGVSNTAGSPDQRHQARGGAPGHRRSRRHRAGLFARGQR
ncbi:MAG: histidine kinase [Burkholderiaceae bacterium]